MLRLNHNLKARPFFYYGVLLIFLIPMLLPPRQAGAQIASETIELVGGESKIITANFPDEDEDTHYKDIGVFHKGGGDLGGFVIYARARGVFSRKNCEVKLSIFAGESGEIVFHHSADWSDWVSVTIPAERSAAVVAVNAMEYQGGGTGCGSGGMDIEIYLEGREPITPTRTNVPIYITQTFTPVRITQTLTPPSNTSTPIPPAESNVNFWADTYNLKRGECTTIHWDVSNATVYWNGDSAPTYNSAKVDGICPSQTKTYTLEVFGLDGQWHNQSLTIYVEEPTSTVMPTVTLTPTQTPIPDCDPTGKLGMILIVTDSNYLAVSTGDSNGWGMVKDALKQYYEPAMVECEGKPVFLDMALPYPQGGYTFVEVKQAILSELKRWRIGIDGRSPLGAIAIIGGPDVIPMPHMPDPTGTEDWIASDDYYADLISDPYLNIDTTITRLPDGHSTDLILNYIKALASGAEPPEGGAILSTLQSSAHRLNFYQDYIDLSLSEDPLYLDDILKNKVGSLTYLISPVWSTWKYNPSAVDQTLIRPDDLVNSMGMDAENSSVGTMLNTRDILFYGLAPGENAEGVVWYAQNAAPNSPFISAYDSQEAQSIPAGAHIFALLPHSADLNNGNRQTYNTISLAMLNNGAHHYIGLTGNMFFIAKNFHSYGGVPNVLADFGTTRYNGAFAQYYYRARSQDPATSFWVAKDEYAKEQGLSSPWDYKTYHSFIYYGLPEKGRYPGIYQGVDYAPLPEPSFDPLPFLKSCPSGDLKDCDGDEISDQTEYDLVERFKPYLIFHPGEGINGALMPGGRDPAFDVYWQVSPAELNGAQGAYITLVHTYPEDNGVDEIDINSKSDILACIDIDVAKWECLISPDACIAGEVLNTVILAYGAHGDNVGEGLVGHPGDTEALRMFVAGSGPAENWTLTHFDWKRHHEGYADEGDPIPLENEIANGLEFYNDSHPILYVSEYKHAMYPTADACENYPFKVSLIESSCNVNPEDCASSDAGRLEYGLPYISPDYNVGELTKQLIDELPGYPGEYAWRGVSFKGLADGKEMFCGSLPPRGDTLMDEPCAGSMENMWFNEVLSPYDR